MTGDILPVRLYSREKTGSGGQQEYRGSHTPLGRDKTRSDGESARLMHLPGDVPCHHMPAHDAKHIVSAVNVAVVPGRETVLTRLRTTMTGVNGTPYTS